MFVPLIEALKPYKSDFNVKYDLSLPTRTPFGNFVLTYHEIVVRTECLNELIIALYQDFIDHKELVKIRGGWATSDEMFKNKFYTEQVFYWLRKTADEFISIIWLLRYFKNKGVYPNKIAISSIGNLIDSVEKKKNELDQGIEKHLKLLKLLNEISNGFKHSLLNSQIHNHQGVDEPVVFALVAFFNDVSNPPNFHQVSLRSVLLNYNDFLIDVRGILELNYQIANLPIND
jgi:hypothetical protein